MMAGWRHGALAAAGLVCAACAATAPQLAETGMAPAAAAAPPTSIEAVGYVSQQMGLPRGFLPAAALPDSLALLPPPPAEATAAKAADAEAYAAALRAPAERQSLAAADARLDWASVAGGFEPILGTSLSDGAKPHAAMLLRRAMTDAALATYRAKNHYKRVRPFVENNAGTCLPEQEPMLRSDGSYPSGHSAIGWMLALVLAEIVPERQDALLKRGHDFGESRVICRAHWLSDTAAGRVIASATFARLQADPTFQAQLALARAEFAGTR